MCLIEYPEWDTGGEPDLRDDVKKHEDFVNRMVKKGYTSKQVRLLCEWYLRVRKNS